MSASGNTGPIFFSDTKLTQLVYTHLTQLLNNCSITRSCKIISMKLQLLTQQKLHALFLKSLSNRTVNRGTECSAFSRSEPCCVWWVKGSAWQQYMKLEHRNISSLEFGITIPGAVCCRAKRFKWSVWYGLLYKIISLYKNVCYWLGTTGVRGGACGMF